MDIIYGLLWDADMEVNDDMHVYFEKRLNTLHGKN